MADFFPTIKLKGDPRQMGVTHGRAMAEQIRSNFVLYMELIPPFTGLTHGQVLDRSRQFVGIVETAAPAVFEEMEGIAEGAGISLESVMVINARTELISATDSIGECTSIGLSGERTMDGRTLLAQNWDWKPESRTRSAFFILEPKHGPRCLVFCEAGQVCKIGLNESGLGVLLNILMTEGFRMGIPVHVLLRLVLNQACVEEAVAMLNNAPRASSSHFLLGDAQGDVVGLELTPEAVAEIRPIQGAVVHTNHFLDPALSRIDKGLSKIPDSLHRLGRATRLLSERMQWDMESLKSILTDHDKGPSSICRHVDACLPTHLRMATVGSLMLDLGRRKIMASWGQPCQSPYEEVALA